MSSTIALVIARPVTSVSSDPFFPAFVAGVNAALAPLQQSLLFDVVPDHEAEMATYRRLAAEQRVDGVILSDLRAGDPRPALMVELGLPAITLGRPDPEGAHRQVGSVSVDDVAGVREVVEMLIGLGHRRLAHVTGPPQFLHVRNRRAAWAGALSAARLRRGRCIHTDFGARQGARATEQLMSTAAPPTAIVYANDLTAMAGMAVLQRRHLAVPGAVSVTGFDDTELARYVHPPLTTVCTDVPAWGERAALELLEVIGGRRPEHVELEPARMVARESVAPPPTTEKGRHR